MSDNDELHGPPGLVAKVALLELEANVTLVAELDGSESTTVIAPDELPAVSDWGALVNESDVEGVAH